LNMFNSVPVTGAKAELWLVEQAIADFFTIH